MSNEAIRVLHYIKHLESGGGETLLYNIYKNIDREQIQFDFLVNSQKEEKLDSKIRELGGKKIVLINKEPRFTLIKIFIVIKKLNKLLRKGNYKIFHIHCSNGQGLLYAYVAKCAGIPVRIVHIHNSSITDGKFIFIKKMFHKICKCLFMNAPTDYIACSASAAEWQYSKKIVKNNSYLLLKNGIEVSKYIFDNTVRYKIRKKLDWDNKKIIINIGRMEKEKNQIFLLDILAELCKNEDKYRLIIIGRGSLESDIKKHAKKLKILSKILFIEYSNEIEKYLWTSDLFVLPSLSEGLGIVAIEAQAAGLPTIVSNTVPQEVYISNLIISVPLNYSANEWAKVIKTKCMKRNSKSQLELIKKAGFDIKNTAYELQKLYMEKNDKII